MYSYVATDCIAATNSVYTYILAVHIYLRPFLLCLAIQSCVLIVSLQIPGLQFALLINFKY